MINNNCAINDFCVCVFLFLFGFNENMVLDLCFYSENYGSRNLPVVVHDLPTEWLPSDIW